MHLHGKGQVLAVKVGWTDQITGLLTDSGTWGGGLQYLHLQTVGTVSCPWLLLLEIVLLFLSIWEAKEILRFSGLVSRILSCLEVDTSSLLQWTFGIQISYLIFLSPAVYTSPIISLLGYGNCMNAAVGCTGNAFSTYLLPRSLPESFLGLDLALWLQTMCFLEQGLQMQYAEEKLAWKSHQKKKGAEKIGVLGLKFWIFLRMKI